MSDIKVAKLKWHRHGGFVNQQNFVLTNLNEAGDDEPSSITFWQYLLCSVYRRVVCITEKIGYRVFSRSSKYGLEYVKNFLPCSYYYILLIIQLRSA